MGQIEWIMYLAAATFYAISSVIYIYSLVFKKDDKINTAVNITIVGLLFHSVSIVQRWVEVGHGPYISMFEVLSSYAWVSIIVFLLVQQKYDKIKIAGFVVLPVAFLMMGAGSTYSRDIQMIPASLRSYWLIAHVGFAKLAFGSILVAVSVSVMYLLKERRLNNHDSSELQKSSFYKKLPELKVMDDLIYKFTASGFLFLSIMIGTGAIWANQTWGRYWGWDPTETWSLITWFLYGICLHLRLNAGWSGKKIAWLIIVSIFIMAFSLFGVGYVYSGLHTSYLID